MGQRHSNYVIFIFFNTSVCFFQGSDIRGLLFAGTRFGVLVWEIEETEKSTKTKKITIDINVLFGVLFENLPKITDCVCREVVKIMTQNCVSKDSYFLP